MLNAIEKQHHSKPVQSVFGTTIADKGCFINSHSIEKCSVALSDLKSSKIIAPITISNEITSNILSFFII